MKSKIQTFNCIQERERGNVCLQCLKGHNFHIVHTRVLFFVLSVHVLFMMFHMTVFEIHQHIMSGLQKPLFRVSKGT